MLDIGTHQAEANGVQSYGRAILSLWGAQIYVQDEDTGGRVRLGLETYHDQCDVFWIKSYIEKLLGYPYSHQVTVRLGGSRAREREGAIETEKLEGTEGGVSRQELGSRGSGTV